MNLRTQLLTLANKIFIWDNFEAIKELDSEVCLLAKFCLFCILCLFFQHTLLTCAEKFIY